VSEIGKPIAETVGNAEKGYSLTSPLKDTLSARLAAVPSGVEQWAENRNFAGNPIRGTDYFGRPISAATTAENILGMALPIPATQGLQAANGEENAGAAVANTIGANAYPTYNLSYAPIEGQTYVQELEQAKAPTKQIQADTQFFSLLGSMSKSKDNAEKTAITQLAKHNSAGAEKTINAYNKQLAQALQPWVQAGGQKYLDAALLEELRYSKLSLSSVGRSERTDVNENPTAYGLPLNASTLMGQALASSGALANNQSNSNNTNSNLL
jgi:hypothetical protein